MESSEEYTPNQSGMGIHSDDNLDALVEGDQHEEYEEEEDSQGLEEGSGSEEEEYYDDEEMEGDLEEQENDFSEDRLGFANKEENFTESPREDDNFLEVNTSLTIRKRKMMKWTKNLK